MEDLLSYELQDFLMFSASSYRRMIELYVEDIGVGAWLPTLLVMGGILVYWKKRDLRALIFVVGLLNLFVAWQFFYERFQEIMWAAHYFAAAFGLQGIIMIWCVQSMPTCGSTDSKQLLLNIPLILGTILAHFTITLILSDRMELVGITPDPTVLVSLIVIMIAKLPVWMFAIPLLWTVFSGLMQYGLGEPYYGLLPAVCIIGVIVHRVGNKGLNISAA